METGCFQFLANTDKNTINIHVQVYVSLMLSFLLDKYLGVE